LTLRVLTDNTFSPLIRLSGQSPSKDANADPSSKLEKSGPILRQKSLRSDDVDPGHLG
jgi:hypothetical protein